jgi:uncharacterized protein (UPF0276 family)
MSLHSPRQAFANGPIPVRAGIGLKFEHIGEIIATKPAAAWFEVHAENYMSAGGPSIQALEDIRRHYPVSVHGVGLSIGVAEPRDRAHLIRLKKLVERIEPGLVSEHLAWCTSGGDFLNDLLPLPYNENSLAAVVAHVDETQDALGRTILIENPSLYVGFPGSDMTEPAFLNEVARRTGCGLLLDVNNVFVSASNLGFDPCDYLDELDMARVGEIHLAGHHVRPVGDKVIRIDDHGSPVSDDVWGLYTAALQGTGPVPTLIEWDTNIPALGALLAEAERAERILSSISPHGGRHASVA